MVSVQCYVKGGTNFRKQAGERRMKRKGPVRRVPVLGDIEMVYETDVDLCNTTVVDEEGKSQTLRC